MATNDNPSRTITLFCWILDVSARPFPVDTEDSTTVAHLKKAIVKEKSTTFANIEADQLVLWKVSVSSSSKPFNSLFLKRAISIGTAQTLKNEIAKEDFLEDDALPEGQRLRSIFPHPEPADETLSIVLRLPSPGNAHCLLRCPSLTLIHSVPPSSLPSVPILELNCFIHDDDPNHVFPVKIAETESVATLKTYIKQEKQVAFEHVDANDLKLWHASIADDNAFKDNVSKIVREETMLSPMDMLSEFFSVVRPRKHLDIIVLCDRPTGGYEYVFQSDQSDRHCSLIFWL
jgi:hypothetical protein